MDETSENIQQQIENPEEVPGITSEGFFECPNPECPGDDEEFTIFFQHEVKRHQDHDTGEATATWQSSEIVAIVCEGCRKIVYLGSGPYAEEEGGPEQQETDNQEGDGNESNYA